MELDFGHGFLPRIGTDNYKAIDRCLGPDQLWNDAIDLPWAIVDAAWAERKPETLKALRTHGTRLLADTFGWRFRFAATFEVKRMAGASWAPDAVVDIHSGESIQSLVRESLRAQARIGIDAYLVPGFVAVDGTEDLRPAYEAVVGVLTEFTEVPAKPYILFVGGHTKGLENVHQLIEELPSFLSGAYVQLTPIETAKDTAAKLDDLAAVYQHASSRGFRVIAGYAGPVAPALRAVGIDAADAGLATAEAFDQSPARHVKRPSPDAEERGGGPRSRMYFPDIDRSLDATEARRVLAVPGAASHLLGCRLPCHRFTGGDPLERAREHSLWARVESAREIARLPMTMRLQALYERTRAQRSRLTTINGALAASGEAPLDTKPLENRLTWITRLMHARSAA